MGIIVTSYHLWIGLITILLCLIFLYIGNVANRFLLSLFIAFLFSFFLFQLTTNVLNTYDLSREAKILINRCLLLLILIVVYITHKLQKKQISFYLQKPEFNNIIEFPFHSIKTSYFLLIGLIINVSIFVPFIVKENVIYLKSTFVFSLLFSLVNATLEELIWRGILLDSLKRYMSVLYAIIITSVGFGLLHLSIGISLLVSLLFSFGGLFYAFVVLKTNSIYPAIFFHFVINMGMVWSGWIL
ncbi:CPBP family intramembrane metalloprotease [Bacillus sp. HMF5848]|uniref:CPBP family intramembrane glutamic endopeptidase n=1 Tax=Bacillus sp. HMF5848 TaxID=2495421 RepID=UPI000F7A2D4B|nr:CPBP family intramembrane glutamic endopeptidase [Bacillus sp. HMF5848]RSK29421.1 CPBP family intramembrane metalloprotease [Bacillus sp. HMF5848]